LVLLVGVCRKKLVLAGVGLVLIGLWDVAMAAGVGVFGVDEAIGAD
jgi:uncharacterized membrane protein YiaA